MTLLQSTVQHLMTELNLNCVATAHVSPSSFLAHEMEVERAAVSFLHLSAMSMTPWAYPEEH